MLLRHEQSYSSCDSIHALVLCRDQRRALPVHCVPHETCCVTASFKQPEPSSDEGAQSEEMDAPLEDAARGERDYVRERLREELKREPTEEEIDEWLRQHTEGY